MGIGNVRILLVDDDPNVIELLNLYLKKEGFQTASARDGREALRMARGEGEALAPQLIVLDVMLPDLDGWAVLKRLREDGNRTPVIMLTAKSEDHDKILGLELGADDYVAKPFNPIEVVARVKAVLRRTCEGSGGGAGDVEGSGAHGSSGASRDAGGAGRDTGGVPGVAGAGVAGTGPRGMDGMDQEQVVTYPGLSVSLSDYEVRVDGQPVPFTRKEIELLWTLASNPGRAFTREQLIQRVWGGDFYGDDRTVDVHIKRIREKLREGVRGAWTLGSGGDRVGGRAAGPVEHSWRIKTVWGVGYKFELLE